MVHNGREAGSVRRVLLFSHEGKRGYGIKVKPVQRALEPVLVHSQYGTKSYHTTIIIPRVVNHNVT